MDTKISIIFLPDMISGIAFHSSVISIYYDFLISIRP